MAISGTGTPGKSVTERSSSTAGKARYAFKRWRAKGRTPRRRTRLTLSIVDSAAGHVLLAGLSPRTGALFR